MTSFFWVRHGPTHAKGAVGWRDIPADLSDQEALARLEAYLPDEALVVSSDLVRASATADAIAGRRERLAHRQGLREMNYGAWDGRNFSDIALSEPELSRAFWSEPGDVAPPGGESWNMLEARIRAEIDAILALSDGVPVICTAHFGVILCALQIASDMAAKSVFSFKVDNLSVTQLDYLPEPQAWRVMGVNFKP